jgi:hypothetical protein
VKETRALMANTSENASAIDNGAAEKGSVQPLRGECCWWTGVSGDVRVACGWSSFAAGAPRCGRDAAHVQNRSGSRAIAKRIGRTDGRLVGARRDEFVRLVFGLGGGT